MNKIYLLLIVILFSCAKKEDGVVIDEPNPIQTLENAKLNCLRWIDRDLYFAYPDNFTNSRNNEFYKQKVRAAINLIEGNTYFGEDYFRIRDTNPALLTPNFQPGLKESEYKSFILIWEDDKFEEFADVRLGGVSNLVDPNAITLVNGTFKRKYAIILRASCFENSNKCSGDGNNSISENGIRALIARQLAFLLRIPKSDCSIDRESPLCVDPSDTQWENEDKIKLYYGQINDKLSRIKNNPNFFQDAEQKVGCLHKPWMQKTIYFAGGSDNLDRNNPFQKELIRETLDNISEESLLGVNYFNYIETNESSLPVILERTDDSLESISFIQIWEDDALNRFIIDDLGGFVPDPHGVTVINAANKDSFFTILRSSCFSKSFKCSGENDGISELGRNALIARQLGFMVGMKKKPCADFPEDVMCPDRPDDRQWSPANKDKWMHKFDNYLEVIGNIPDFYNQYYEPKDEEEEI